MLDRSPYLLVLVLAAAAAPVAAAAFRLFLHRLPFPALSARRCFWYSSSYPAVRLSLASSSSPFFLCLVLVRRFPAFSVRSVLAVATDAAPSSVAIDARVWSDDLDELDVPMAAADPLGGGHARCAC